MHSELASFLSQKVPSSRPEVAKGEAGDACLCVQAESIGQVCQVLRDDPQWDFRILQVITGCDYLAQKGEGEGEGQQARIEVSYILTSLSKNHDLILKVKLPRENPEVDSVCGLWAAANFQERECFDMLGVRFKGHPDLRRILCPDDWEGYPLRRDYKVQQSWHDMEVEPEAKMNLPEREFETRQKEMAKQHREREGQRGEN